VTSWDPTFSPEGAAVRASSVGEPADLAQLSRAAALDLGHFRPDHVEERVRRALEREEAADARALARLLAAEPAVRTRFRRSVAISHGGCFRDPSQFTLLEDRLLPALVSEGRRLTAWSAGCADGAELYSLGMVLVRLGAIERALLLGSDLLEENVALARRGRYEGHPVPAAIRARVRWERRDLIADGPPEGRWRLVLCRNVAIYLSPTARRMLYRTLVSALAPDGVLLLGRSERLLDPAALGLRPVAPHAYGRAR
jgi:chemotaxis protein methyltransferase CheR